MKKILFLFSFISIVVVACSSSEDSNDSPATSYDKTALLTNWADNIIIPSFENYQTKVNVLSASVATFNGSPSEINLATLRTSWLEAYKAFQSVSMYNIGKAEEITFKESANTYPANATQIDINISTGNYNLSQNLQFDRQGFPGLDYLINGLATTDSGITAFYTTDALASNRKTYLTAVTTRLKSQADAIVNDWKSAYRNTFVSNNGNSVSSSLNKMTNNFVKNLEKDIRTGKLGIPAGLFSNGTKYPEKTEAYYKSDVSRELLTIAIKAEQDFFNGKNFNNSTTGESLKSYLDYLNAVRSGQKLSDIINNQFTATYTSINLLNNSISQQINSDNSKVIAAYNVLQQNVVYIKLDMMQALNISIDYVDGDGD